MFELQNNSEIGWEEIGYWHQRSVELADLLCPQCTADLFVNFPNFIDTKGANAKVHTMGYSVPFLKGLSSKGELIESVCLVGPNKGALSKAMEQLATAIDGSQITCLFPAHQDIFLIRATAIGMLVQRVPFNCLTYIQEIRVKRIERKCEGKPKHLFFLQVTFSPQHKHRLYMPVKERPVLIQTIHKGAVQEAMTRMNQLTIGHDEH